MKFFPERVFDFNLDTNECYDISLGRNCCVCHICYISNIIACQILGVYNMLGNIKGYELNIITYDDDIKKEIDINKIKRIYLLSYKDFGYVKECAIKISKFINIPVIFS